MALFDSTSLDKTRQIASRAMDRALMSVVNGLVYAAGGAARPHIGSAPKDRVFKEGKLEVWRIRPRDPEALALGPNDFEARASPRIAVPILLIPPLMVRPYIYDLRPEHSMVRTLRNAGLDVFYIDFGVPDRADEGLRLDDYVLDFVPKAVNATLEASGATGLTLAGYCMGGIFALLHVAAFRDERVKNLVTIGAPVNFEKLGVLTVAARVGAPLVDRILDRMGNVPGQLSSAGFRLMGGTRVVTKYANLLVNLYDEEYVRAFDAIDTWLREMIPYPKEAFRQLLKEVVHGNKMLKNELTFDDRRADLRNVQCPLLSFTGNNDNIATRASTEAVLELVGSHDKTYRVVPGGHIGVVAGSAAPRTVWHPMIAWLVQRSARWPSPRSPSIGTGRCSK